MGADSPWRLGSADPSPGCRLRSLVLGLAYGAYRQLSFNIGRTAATAADGRGRGGAESCWRPLRPCAIGRTPLDSERELGRLDRQPWLGSSHDHPHRPPLRASEGRGPAGARHLRHGRRPRLRHVACDPPRAARGRRRRDRARHAVLRSDGRRPGDPGVGAARAAGRPDDGEDARHGPRFPQPRRRHADRPDGLLQPDLFLRQRALPRRCQGRRRRRPDRRRPAAGGRRRALPAGARRAASTSSASRRRPPTTGGCPRSSPIRRVSSTTCRSSASPARRSPDTGQGRRGGGKDQAAHHIAGCGRLRRQDRGAGASHRRARPTASWSARRWSARSRTRSTARAGRRAGPSRRSSALVAELADGVRAARAVAAEQEEAK